MVGILALLALVGCIICQIIVAIKIFQNDGALKGILALICGLFGFIWGWMNASRLGIKNIMMIWTVLIIIYLFWLLMAVDSATVTIGYTYSLIRTSGSKLRAAQNHLLGRAILQFNQTLRRPAHDPTGAPTCAALYQSRCSCCVRPAVW